MKQPILINDSVKLWPETLLFMRRLADRIEIATTEGIIAIEGTHLEHLIRKLLHDSIQQLKDKWQLDPFGCRVDSVSLCKRSSSVSLPLPFPDSCPVPAGWMLIETQDFADYHPKASLQLIARQHEGFLMCFANTAYHQGGPGAAEGLLRRLGEELFHISSWEEEAFLKWPVLPRIHVHALEERPHRPAEWDSMDALVDLRSNPQQQRFMKRLPEPEGPDIGR